MSDILEINGREIFNPNNYPTKSEFTQTKDNVTSIGGRVTTLETNVATAGTTANQAKTLAEESLASYEAVNANANEAKTNAANALSIAQGITFAIVFDTEAALNTWLADSSHTANLKIGTNFYIRATDVPDYWWDGTTKQILETKKVDLTDYVKKTQIATSSAPGLVQINGYGLVLYPNTGVLCISKASNSQIDTKASSYLPIVPANLDYAVKVALTTNTLTLTESEKAAARNWMGYSPISEDEYEALADKSGIHFVYPNDIE